MENVNTAGLARQGGITNEPISLVLIDFKQNFLYVLYMFKATPCQDPVPVIKSQVQKQLLTLCPLEKSNLEAFKSLQGCDMRFTACIFQ